MDISAANRKLLIQIAANGSGVDQNDLTNTQLNEASALLASGLIVVNQVGWFGPRYIATDRGRSALKQTGRQALTVVR